MEQRQVSPFRAPRSSSAAYWFWPAPPEPWEFACGPPNTLDQAARRVAPVLGCPGGGYIAVGAQAGFGGADVYACATDAAGWTIWEHTYDLGALQRYDEGVAIVEIPNAGGFMILSNLHLGFWYPILTRVDCGGNYQWSRIYRDVYDFGLRGYDLVRTETGDSSYGTAPGDWAVAGVWYRDKGKATTPS